MVWKQFLEKMPDDCYTLGIKNFVKILHCFRDKCIFALYAEIQNGHQNGGKTIFEQPGVKNFCRNRSSLHHLRDIKDSFIVKKNCGI